MPVYNVPLILFITSASQRALVISAHQFSFILRRRDNDHALHQDWRLLNDGNFYIYSYKLIWWLYTPKVITLVRPTWIRIERISFWKTVAVETRLIIFENKNTCWLKFVFIIQYDKKCTHENVFLQKRKNISEIEIY